MIFKTKKQTRNIPIAEEKRFLFRWKGYVLSGTVAEISESKEWVIFYREDSCGDLPSELHWIHISKIEVLDRLRDDDDDDSDKPVTAEPDPVEPRFAMN